MELRFDHSEHEDSAMVVVTEAKVAAECIADLCESIQNSSNAVAIAAMYAVVYELATKVEVGMRALFSVSSNLKEVAPEYKQLLAMAREVAINA